MTLRISFVFYFSLCFLHWVAADEVKLEECEQACLYKGSPDYAMNCTSRACSYIPASIDMGWGGYYYMETLYLSGNPIKNVTAFPVYSSLKTLDLSACQITTIEKRAFANLEALNNLSLAYNQLTKLDQDDFEGLEGHLEQLDLKGNQITDITDNLFYLPLSSVRRLDLSFNKIKRISANGFTDLEKLKFLHLDHNELEVLDNKDFLGLENLEDLYLQHNSIRRLNNSTFVDCTNLMTLELSNNQIQFMSKNAFHGLNNLRVLRLERNSISQIKRGVFEALTMIQHIYFDYNPIKVIESGAFPLSIQRISMENLNELHKIHNGTFTNLTQLEAVEITHCKNLALLDKAAFNQQNTNLRVLRLHNNKLTTLYETLVNWTALEDLTLHGNHWKCNCDMAWVQHTDNIPKDVSHEMKCYEPIHLHGQRVSDVDYASFSCAFYDEHRGSLEAGIIVIVTVIFVSLAVSLAYKFRYTVFPCVFTTPGKYSTMYNAVNTDEEEAGITFKKETEEVIPGPTAV